MDEIREEIRNIEKSAERIRVLAQGNNAIVKNASIILNFIYLLKFNTPVADE
jgi:hypothetical protein